MGSSTARVAVSMPMGTGTRVRQAFDLSKRDGLSMSSSQEDHSRIQQTRTWSIAFCLLALMPETSSEVRNQCNSRSPAKMVTTDMPQKVSKSPAGSFRVPNFATL